MAINFPSALDAITQASAVRRAAENGNAKVLRAEKLGSNLPKKEANVFESIVNNTVELFKNFKSA